jgi:hypothetical protein
MVLLDMGRASARGSIRSYEAVGMERNVEEDTVLEMGQEGNSIAEMRRNAEKRKGRETDCRLVAALIST